jgi:uncharacterized membrane protein YdcZ (DUF606 family)
VFRARRAEAADRRVDPEGRPVRASRGPGGRNATGAGAIATGAGLLARVVRLVVGVVVLIIVVGILFELLKANSSNGIVSEVKSWTRWLAGPFDGIFSVGSARDTIAANWGIAAAVYLAIGGVFLQLLGRTRR